MALNFNPIRVDVGFDNEEPFHHHLNIRLQSLIVSEKKIVIKLYLN